jgi:molecular chaperone DnaK (HSP70)
MKPSRFLKKMTVKNNNAVHYIHEKHTYENHFFFSDAKRLIGRKFDESAVQSDMKHWPFNVINDATKPKLQVEYKGETKTFFPEEISSMVLNKMKETAEAFLGKVGKCFV